MCYLVLLSKYEFSITFFFLSAATYSQSSQSNKGNYEKGGAMFWGMKLIKTSFSNSLHSIPSASLINVLCSHRFKARLTTLLQSKEEKNPQNNYFFML